MARGYTFELPLLAAVVAATALMLTTLTALMMMFFGRCELDDLTIPLVVVGPSTLALALSVSWWCVRVERTMTDATSAALCGASLAGGANVPLVVLIAGLVSSTQPELVAQAVMLGCLSGMILGCPFGFLFGAACLQPIRFGAARPRSLDLRDRTSQLCWSWLAKLSGVCGALVGAGALLLPGGRGEGALLSLILCVVVVALGLWGSRAASARIVQRRLWLKLVAGGAVAGWSLIPRGELSEEEVGALPPLFHGRPSEEATSVLVRAVPSRDAGGAYRSTQHLIPVALVDRPIAGE